jgi:Protein of unknown function (DUF2927)
MPSKPFACLAIRQPFLIGLLAIGVSISSLLPASARPIAKAKILTNRVNIRTIPARQPLNLIPRPVSLTNAEITPEQIKYFLEVAMGVEFSKAKMAGSRIRKWQGAVRVQYFGSPTREDLATLQTVIGEINELANGNIQLQLVDRNPNLTIHFAPESKFSRLEPNYEPGNYGFFWTRWDNNHKIYNANILITTTQVTQKERSHLIREELTQSLGLMRDSLQYSDSMFYQPWTDVTQYAAIDKALIKMLYDPNILPGMTQAEVLKVFSSLQAQNRKVPANRLSTQTPL